LSNTGHGIITGYVLFPLGQVILFIFIQSYLPVEHTAGL